MDQVGKEKKRCIKEILGQDYQIREFKSPTRTVAEAAAAIGCSEGQIAKSVMFRTHSNRPVLVVACGYNRVDTTKVSMLVGEEISKAEPDYVREQSGYSIGGVPPFGHKVCPMTLLDKDLEDFDEIWAAAGAPNAVFQLTPGDLKRLSESDFHELALRSGPGIEKDT